MQNGHYLVAQEGDVGQEYSPEGSVVSQYEVSMQGKPFAGGHGPNAWGNRVNNAIRLKNGNTLIATGNQHSILEVNPSGETLWSLMPGDIPDMEFAMTKQLEELPNGNLIIGNTYGASEYPQLIEITNDKEIVWTFKAFVYLGDIPQRSLPGVDSERLTANSTSGFILTATMHTSSSKWSDSQAV